MMGHRSTVLVCFCILAQQMLIEGSSLERQRYARNASKKDEKDWKSKATSKFFNELERIQEQLEQRGGDELLRNFIENPGCGSTKSSMVKADSKELLLEAFAVASLKVVEGCPEDALKTMLKMVNELIEVPVDPVLVTNTSACSTEADEAIRMILSEIKVLREAYTLVAASVYSGAGCDQLSADLLPFVVRFSYSISNKEKKFDNYEMLPSNDAVIHKCDEQLHKLKEQLKGEKDGDKDGEQDENSRKRRDTDDCEESWERSIYNAVEDLPIVNTLWELGSAVGYAIAGCSDVAASRGKKGASSLIATLSMFFGSSRR